jgi:hypothetical protein
MKITIEKLNNGYLVRVADALKANGPYVYKATEELKMLEDVGKAILDQRVKVELR